MSRRRSASRRLMCWCAATLTAVVLTGCTPPNLPAPLPPDTTETAPAPPVVGGVISIGVDDDIRGFNPYVASQYSPAAAAISGLVLPGVFAPGATGPDDAPTALVTAAAVTATDPFTVTYNLNQGAAWSDGTPIAAEDFTYLWRQMTTTTDVVSPGGYDLISTIQSLDAGKTVVVVFTTAYADWRTLFSPLLPARTLKDEPGGFSTALQTGIPVAGSRYRMDSYDPVIGQVKLVRNDKYWATESATSTTNSVIFRAGASADLVESLGRGDLQAVYLQPAAPAAASLSALGSDIRQFSVPLPAMAGLRFNTAAGRPAADPALRKAVAAAVTTADVRAALSGGNPAAVLEPVSQLTLPGDPGAAGLSVPSGITDDAAGVADALGPAGYQRTGLYYSLDGAVATLVLGYLVGDEPARAAARVLQGQLGAAGIQVDLVAEAETEFFAPLTAASVPDLVLSSIPRGPSDRAEAVSVLQCGTAFDPVIAPSSSTTTSTSGTGTDPEAAPAQLCDTQVRTAVAGYLRGGAVGDLDQVGWDDLTVLPLGEPVAVLALGPGLAAVTPSQDKYGMLWGGPLRELPEWPTPA